MANSDSYTLVHSNLVLFQVTVLHDLYLNCASLSGSLFISWFSTIKDKLGARNIQYMARVLIAFMVKLLTFFRIVRCGLGGRQSNIYPSNLLELNPGIHSPAKEAVKEENHVLPCSQRLQRLETLFQELSTKPAGIPLDKEQLLLESLDRIKYVEFDLEKTKRVSGSPL